MQHIKCSTLLALVLLAFSCKNVGGADHLKGNIANAANLQVLLEQAFFDRSNTAVNRVTCDANGQFDIELKDGWKEGLYRLSIGAKRMYFVVDGSEGTVEIKGDLTTVDRLQVEVEGSPTLTCYKERVAEIVTPQGGQMTPDLAKEIVTKGCTPLMRAFLATQLLGGQPLAFMTELKKYGQDLTDQQPDSRYTKDYNTLISNVERQSAQQAATEKIQVGQPAPEISLPGPDGKTHALSSLKGKVVLLDFWASWCGPCRRANPHVVEVYGKYKDKGFEVFSVSLDGLDPRVNVPADQAKQRKEDGKANWIAAIKKDGLIWDNHVSDLQHWGSAPAATYGVSSIPKTFLIGRDGNIVAINPRDNLEQELLKVL